MENQTMTVEEVLNRNKSIEDNLYPIEYDAFCEMDDEEKRWYLSEVRMRYNATDSMIADMMGVNRVTVSRWASSLTRWQFR